MKNLELQFSANVNGEYFEFTHDFTGSYDDSSDVIESCIEQYTEENITEEYDEPKVENLTCIDSIFEDSNFIDWETLVRYYFDSETNDLEVMESAYALGIEPEDIQEAYQGKNNSDAEFAQELADQLGYLDNHISWPFTCIDWDKAGEEIMMDYSEKNGHYFRNL